MADTETLPEFRKFIPWKLAVVFIFFAFTIILAGNFYYSSQKKTIFKEQQNNLSGIATLKISQIEQWHKERLGNAATISNNEPLINTIREYLGNESAPDLKREITKWMESVCNGYEYCGITILDLNKKARIEFIPSDSLKIESFPDEIDDVIRYKRIVMTDLRMGKDMAYMDLLIPLKSRSNNIDTIFGVLILQIDPSKSLFPIIQSWPVPSKTAETLLLRKEGDSVLFLNELRFQNNTALKLKHPISELNLLASKAISGYKGIADGVDYRNKPVIGYIAEVPGLPWYMVAKVDKDEIRAPLKRLFYSIGFFIVLLILISASLFGFWIWQKLIKGYKKQLENERAIRESDEKFTTALRLSEERYRNIFNSLIEGFCIVEMVFDENNTPVDYRFLEINSAFETQTGLHDAKGKLMRDLVPSNEQYWFDIYGNVALTGESVRFENEAKALNRWFEVRASRVDDNQSQHVAIYFNDITERKLTEDAMRESEDKFKYIFDHSVIGKSITFPSGEMNVNKAFCDMMGYSPEELVTKKWQDMTHADDLERTQREAESLLLHEKESSRFLKRYIKKNGDVLWTDVSTVLRCDKENNPLYFMTTINDITERKNAEDALRKAETQLINYNKDLEKSVALRTEQLEEANKELEAFSYSVSHDLRAPLRSLNGFTKILQEDYETILDKEGNRICGIISSSASQMGELIDDLLSFSRIGRSSLTSSDIDMKKMAQLIFEGITSPAERERIKLTFGKMHTAVGDVTLFGHVWTNLISNAIKYSSKKDVSKINIGSYADEKMVVFFIRDNGVGFDMKYAHKLFGVFQRLHTEAEFEGNGVGLAIIQRIIAKHGGKVWAEGELGKGATFYFSLPVQEEHETQSRYNFD